MISVQLLHPFSSFVISLLSKIEIFFRTGSRQRRKTKSFPSRQQQRGKCRFDLSCSATSSAGGVASLMRVFLTTVSVVVFASAYFLLSLSSAPSKRLRPASKKVQESFFRSLVG